MDDRTDWQRRIGVGESCAGYGQRTGPTRTSVVPREDNGRPAGTQTEHKSGRVDATVYVPPVHRKATVG